MKKNRFFKYFLSLFVLTAVGLFLFVVLNPGYKTLNTLNYAGSEKFEFTYTDFMGHESLLDIDFNTSQMKFKGPIAIYYMTRNHKNGTFIAPKNIDIADTLGEAETIAVVEEVSKPVSGESSKTVYHLHFFDKNMIYKYSIISGTSYREKPRDIFERIKEMNISRENPDSLGAYAEWKQKILDGSYVSMIDDIKEYPENLDLETNPGLLSLNDADSASIILEVNVHSIENEDPKDYIRSDFSLNCRLVKPFDGEPTTAIFFTEWVGRKNIGTYQVAVTLWSPIYRISAIDPTTGSLIAWRNVYVEEGPKTLVNPQKFVDSRYYISNFDAWELFLESFSE